ncbi:MAG: hypothetical protein QY310_13780 [Candidatus Jettenia sp. CY-1]|nr:hypothetical protein [Candidatus Jettenia sp.]WKZ18481.1 MAG: hypothetical protein QY310_13780 [Candidatus Jettenia sp. CY-1]
MAAIICIDYYQKEQYQLLLQTATDRDKLDATYDGWLKSFRKAFSTIKKSGFEPVKVNVDVKELLAYCIVQDLENNAITRSQFCADLAKEGKWEAIENN